MAMPSAITSEAHEATSVDRAPDRFLDIERSTLASRDRRKSGQPCGLGHASWPRSVSVTGPVDRLERLNTGLDHHPASLLDSLGAERDDVADTELAQAAGPLDTWWLRYVMEAVPGLEQQVPVFRHNLVRVVWRTFGGA
jgi:hypothetical protein